MRGLHVLGIYLSNRVADAFDKSGPEGSIAEDNKVEDEIKQIKRELSVDTEDMEARRQQAVQIVKSMPDAIYQQALREREQLNAALLDGKVFVSDQEASMLSWYVVNRVLAVRTALCRVQSATINIFIYFRIVDNVTPENFADYMYRFLEPMLQFSRNYMPLISHVRNVKERSLFRMTWNNMIGRFV